MYFYFYFYAGQLRFTRLCIVLIYTVRVSTSNLKYFDPNEDPYVRIATGDYEDQLNEFGRDSALAANLHSLSHELIHYWQWLDTGTITERGVIVRAQNMVSKYSLDVDHP